jgi:predicted RNA binding protein YcfA (HicA-like mRNA interferase family)
MPGRRRRSETDRDMLSAGASPLAVKVRDVIKMIESDGWRWKVTRGSHRQYKHPTKPGRVTVPGHPRDDVAAGTLRSILKQAGLK